MKKILKYINVAYVKIFVMMQLNQDVNAKAFFVENVFLFISNRKVKNALYVESRLMEKYLKQKMKICS